MSRKSIDFSDYHKNTSYKLSSIKLIETKFIRSIYNYSIDSEPLKNPNYEIHRWFQIDLESKKTFIYHLTKE